MDTVRFWLCTGVVLLTLAGIPWVSLLAQEEDNAYETLLEEQEVAVDDPELLDRLERLRERPLDLNRASRQELEQIPWIDPVLAERIVQERQAHGPFERLSDLQRIAGIDAVFWERIAPFVGVTPASVKCAPPASGHWRLRVQWQEIDLADPATDFRGSPARIYQRATLRLYDRFEVGILTEKDPGEMALTDHRVAYFYGQQLGPVQRLLIGNYRLEVGQGLLLWNPTGLTKGAEILSTLKKRGRGIRPYRSAVETAALQGLYAEWTGPGVELALFVSRAHRDAGVNSEGKVESLPHSGFHRTSGELARRNRLGEELLGGRLTWHPDTRFQMGLTTLQTRFSLALAPANPERRRFALNGRSNRVHGADLDLFVGPANGFAEIGVSRGGGMGLVVGLLIDLGALNLGTLMRHYDADFHSPYGFAFGDRAGPPQNEEGALLSGTFIPHRGTRLTAYHDQFKQLWRGYQEPVPARGEESFFQVEQRLPGRVALTARFRFKMRQVPRSISDGLGATVTRLQPRHQRNLRLHGSWKMAPGVTLESRWESVIATYPATGDRVQGSLWFLGAAYRRSGNVLMRGRLVGFASDAYEARLFVFEPDLPGVLRNRALHGRGWRFYLLVRQRLGGGFGWSMKYAFEQAVREQPRSRTHQYGIQVDWRW